MLKVALLTLLLAGCGYQIPIAGDVYDGPTNPQPGQDEAAHIVWNLVYGMPDGTEPPIMWHFDDNCADSYGDTWGPKYGKPGAFIEPHVSHCIFGQYESSGWVTTTEFDAPGRIDIEWHGGFSADQIFAHELCHAWKQYTTGDGDTYHTSDCFVGDDGVPLGGSGTSHIGSWTYTANAALSNAGL